MHKVLYLLGIGLLEEERLKAETPHNSSPFRFSAKAGEVGMVAALEALVGSHRIASHKELLAWVLLNLKKSLGFESEAACKGKMRTNFNWERIKKSLRRDIFKLDVVYPVQPSHVEHAL